MLADVLADLRRTEEVLHHIEALIYSLRILERKKNPSPQKARTHRTHGAVEHVEEALSFGVERLDKLEVAHGEAVEPYVALLLDAGQRVDMRCVLMARQVEIMQNGPCSYYPMCKALYPEALERGRAELFEQAFVGGFRGEEPLLEVEYKVALRKLAFDAAAEAVANEKLFGRHVGDNFVDIVGAALGAEEFAGAYIKEGHAPQRLAHVERGKKVVLAAREHVVAEGHAGSDKLDDIALDEFFCQLGIFELFADGHTLARTHELGQIGVERVVREAGKLDILGGTVGTARERDSEDFGRHDGVVGKGLVEVADSKEEHRVGVLCLHLGVLLHQRRLDILLSHWRRAFCGVRGLLWMYKSGWRRRQA